VSALLTDPAAVEKRIADGQRRVAHGHSPFACGLAWARALGDSAERPMRLNLGCGDKILPGYVNVDVVEARAGMKPDVICDLHDLAPFASASADEILSVHVVEHFWRWEVRDVLREWVRVLKPGGRMIVECPNILSACQTFLENPELFSREDQNGQRTMWVFYGDPKWKDPLMIHRWGYTPESLHALLTEVGLADVRQEPAQFKLREPRDMRIVGVKP
jgi:SAM-dependent methyltransferase